MFQEVILQENLEKEDEVLVSLAGLKQVSLSMQTGCILLYMSYYSLLTCYSSFVYVININDCTKSSQIKDILKGALRFNQSQLEAEENEEITIADDHYTSTAAAETALSVINHHSDQQQQENSRRSRDSDLDGIMSTDEKEEEEQAMTPPEQQVK